MENIKISEVLVSLQRALLGKVTNNLRAVNVDVRENVIAVIFFYDANLSEIENELASLADTEIISDFPPPEYRVNFTIKVVKYPNPVPFIGRYAYLRYESPQGM